MTRHLYRKQIRIFDYPKFAEPFRDSLRENAEQLAKAARIEIEFIRKRNVRKENLLQNATDWLPLCLTDQRLGFDCKFVEECETNPKSRLANTLQTRECAHSGLVW